MDSPLKTLRNLFQEMMAWEGEELMPVDFVMASYLTAFLPGAVEKAWGDLCGPPAIGKTEILRALDDGQQRTIMVDTLTENAFASAMRDPDQPEKDFSLLYQLSSGRAPKGPKVLVVKEFSTFLNMRKEKVDKIFADLRAAYDGSFATAAGNIGLDTRTDLQFGLITACTEKLDDFRRTNQTLGERTLVCRIGRETATYAARAAVADHVVKGCRMKKASLRARIKIQTRKAINDAVRCIKSCGGRVTQGDSYIGRVARTAALATSIRSSPLSKRSYTNLAEGAARFAGQLTSWGDCRVLFDGRASWTDEDYALVRRIAQDTMPPEFLRGIHTLYKKDTPQSIEEIRQGAMADGDFYRQLKQWEIIGVLHRTASDEYYLDPLFREDLSKTGFMEGLE